jgi:2-methylisocitrate lyase-like PEP mutase family enzyme
MTDIGATFRDLHRPGDPFVLANAWDMGSAKMLKALGAKALATSSAAHAFTLGRPDGGISRDEALAHAQDLAALGLPVSGDFENGFGEAPDTCAATVRLAFEAGLAGISIEDTALPGDGPYPFDLAVERIRAAVSAARALPKDFVLVARADGILRGSYDADEAIRRLRAFDAAGADCLYAPFPASMEDQRRIVACTAKPVNVLIAGPYAKKPRSVYTEMGAARLSLGSSLARITHRAILDAATAMFGDGDFGPLTNGVSGAEIDRLLS